MECGSENVNTCGQKGTRRGEGLVRKKTQNKKNEVVGAHRGKCHQDFEVTERGRTSSDPAPGRKKRTDLDSNGKKMRDARKRVVRGQNA